MNALTKDFETRPFTTDDILEDEFINQGSLSDDMFEEIQMQENPKPLEV